MFGVRFCVVEICETTPMWRFVHFHHREQLLTHICAAKHTQGSSCMLTEVGHRFRNEANELCGPTVSYFAFSVPLHCSSISCICICTGAVSTLTANGLRSSSKLLFCASKSPKRRANSVRSALSLSAKWAFGNTVVALTWFNITWQQGKWDKLHCCICVSHKRSFTWNAFTASYISVIMRSRPWSWRDAEMRSYVSQKRQLTFPLFIPQNCGVFSFTVHELTDFLAQLKKSIENFSPTPHRTSVW